MATTLTAATLTVTLTESISLNGKDQGATNSFTVASINEIYKHIVTATTTATTFLKFGTAASAGTLIRANVSYLRITNLDDTNHAGLIFQNENDHEMDRHIAFRSASGAAGNNHLAGGQRQLFQYYSAESGEHGMVWNPSGKS